MIEFVTIFRDFGYPALVTGVLLWIFVTKLEQLSTTIRELRDEVISCTRELKELRNDLRDKGSNR